jgi:hypothetical protein
VFYRINAIKENKMSEFIRSIGNCRVNGIGFDLYENKDDTATIRPNRLGADFPNRSWIKFDSVESAEAAIDHIAGEDTEGAQRVQNLKNHWL